VPFVPTHQRGQTSRRAADRTRRRARQDRPSPRLQRDLSLRPVEGRYRVAIFDQFEVATTEAQNALLKTLEEPPDYAVLIVLASDPELLLPTIISRCQQVPLRPLTSAQVREALIKQWNVEANHANLLAHLSGGRLGWAVTPPAIRPSCPRAPNTWTICKRC
jgi:DNA polymerase III delta prime subunit